MTNPRLVATPFAENGVKNDIPESTAAQPQLATLESGFPDITQTPISQGGVPPERADFNGILNLYGEHVVHLSKGLPYEFDSTFAQKIGGYPLHARVMLTNGDIVRNTMVNNINNPNSNMDGWELGDGDISDANVILENGRTQREKNSESVHVLDFKKEGLTDQQAIQSAVDYCIESNRALSFDGVAMISTENIKNLWKVAITGSGAISRSGSVLLTNPDNTKTTELFFSPNGSNSNDGLTHDFPRLSVSITIRDLYINPQFYNRGELKIKLLPGNYPVSIFSEVGNLKFPQTQRPVFIEGTHSGDFPNILHETIVSGDSSQAGYSITATTGVGRSIKIHGINFKDMYSAVQLWAGFHVETRFNYYKNVYIPEFYQGTGNISSLYNIFEDASISQYVQYSSRGTLNRNLYTNCRKGAYLSRNSSAHVDNNEFQNVEISIMADLNSRISSEGNKFRGVSIALAMQSGGIIADNTTNDYGVIGVDTMRVLCIDGVGQELRWNGYSGGRDHIHTVWAKLQTINENENKYLTSNTTTQSNTLLNIPKGFFVSHINKVSIKIYGFGRNKSTSRIRLEFGGIISYIDLIGDTTTGFCAEFDVFCGADSKYVDSHGRSYDNTTVYINKSVLHGLESNISYDSISGERGAPDGAIVKVAGECGAGSVISVRRVELIVR